LNEPFYHVGRPKSPAIFLGQGQDGGRVEDTFLKNVKGIFGFVFQLAGNLLKPLGRLLLGIGLEDLI